MIKILQQFTIVKMINDETFDARKKNQIAFYTCAVNVFVRIPLLEHEIRA
jgi:hypothetical protein